VKIVNLLKQGCNCKLGVAFRLL